MKDLKLVVDEKACVHCGACVKDCPARVFIMDGGIPKIAPEASDRCIECQHCLAVCPTGALSIFGLDPKNSLPFTQGALPTREQMKLLVRGRRSVRQWRDENVAKETIDALLTDLAYAPTGCNNLNLTFLVVDDKGEMQKLRDAAIGALEAQVGSSQMPEFLAALPGMYRKDGTDALFRGAPHLLIVAASEQAPCGKADAIIALSYFELLAQSAGLGTTWCGMLDFAALHAPEIRSLLGIGKSTPFYAMMFGYPAVKYARTPQRDSAATITRYRA